MQTAAIEGEMLDRLSVQSSLRRIWGWTPAATRPSRASMAWPEMMVERLFRICRHR